MLSPRVIMAAHVRSEVQLTLTHLKASRLSESAARQSRRSVQVRLHPSLPLLCLRFVELLVIFPMTVPHFISLRDLQPFSANELASIQRDTRSHRLDDGHTTKTFMSSPREETLVSTSALYPFGSRYRDQLSNLRRYQRVYQRKPHGANSDNFRD